MTKYFIENVAEKEKGFPNRVIEITELGYHRFAKDKKWFKYRMDKENNEQYWFLWSTPFYEYIKHQQNIDNKK